MNRDVVVFFCVLVSIGIFIGTWLLMKNKSSDYILVNSQIPKCDQIDCKDCPCICPSPECDPCDCKDCPCICPSPKCDPTDCKDCPNDCSKCSNDCSKCPCPPNDCSKCPCPPNDCSKCPPTTTCTIANCKTCSDDGTTCSECDQGYDLSSDNTKCTKHKAACTIANCKTCSVDGTACSECVDGYTFSDASNSCVKQKYECDSKSGCTISPDGTLSYSDCNTSCKKYCCGNGNMDGCGLTTTTTCDDSLDLLYSYGSEPSHCCPKPSPSPSTDKFIGGWIMGYFDGKGVGYRFMNGTTTTIAPGNFGTGGLVPDPKSQHPNITNVFYTVGGHLQTLAGEFVTQQQVSNSTPPTYPFTPSTIDPDNINDVVKLIDINAKFAGATGICYDMEGWLSFQGSKGISYANTLAGKLKQYKYHILCVPGDMPVYNLTNNQAWINHYNIKSNNPGFTDNFTHIAPMLYESQTSYQTTKWQFPPSGKMQAFLDAWKAAWPVNQTILTFQSDSASGTDMSGTTTDSAKIIGQKVLSQLINQFNTNDYAGFLGWPSHVRDDSDFAKGSTQDLSNITKVLNGITGNTSSKYSCDPTKGCITTDNGTMTLAECQSSCNTSKPSLYSCDPTKGCIQMDNGTMTLTDCKSDCTAYCCDVLGDSCGKEVSSLTSCSGTELYDVSSVPSNCCSKPTPPVVDYSKPMIGWWFYSYGTNKDMLRLINGIHCSSQSSCTTGGTKVDVGPEMMAKNLGFSDSSINTIFNLASGTMPYGIPRSDDTIGINVCDSSGNYGVFQPMPMQCGKGDLDETYLTNSNCTAPIVAKDHQEFNVFNLGGWGDINGTALYSAEWTLDSFSKSTKAGSDRLYKSAPALLDNKATNLINFMKANGYNVLSLDIEGVNEQDSNSNYAKKFASSINTLFRYVKNAGLGTMLTLPGFGVKLAGCGKQLTSFCCKDTSQCPRMNWFKNMDDTVVDKLCLMYYNLIADTESSNYTADTIKNNTLLQQSGILDAKWDQKRILGLSCATPTCNGLLSDPWIRNKFKGGVSVWVYPSVPQQFNQFCPKGIPMQGDYQSAATFCSKLDKDACNERPCMWAKGSDGSCACLKVDDTNNWTKPCN